VIEPKIISQGKIQWDNGTLVEKDSWRPVQIRKDNFFFFFFFFFFFLQDGGQLTA